MIRRLPAWLLPALAVVMAAPRADAGCVWESGPSFPTLFARSDAAAVNQAGVIVVLGGRPMTNSQSPAHFLDLPAGATTWGSGPLIAPARINPAATVDANGQIIIFGGTTFDDTGGGNGAFQTGVAYDIVLGEGMATAPLASTRTRARFGFATDNLHFFYIVGGRQASATTPQNPNADTIVDFLDRYDPATDTWNSTLSALPAGRTDAAAVYDGLGHILLIGGASDVSGTTQATVFSYDIATDTWTTLANPEPAAMSRQAAVLGGDGLVYVAGGTNGGPTNSASVFIFDPVALTWSTGPSLSVSRRGAAIALANDGYIYVMGGGGNIGTTTVERLFTGSGAADCDMNGVPDVCEVGPEPIIDVHPADTSGCQGGSATLTVTASGAASLTLTYQWQKFNTGTSVWDDLVGQTAAALTINPVGMADAGQFRVVVTNTCGTATSNAAILSVITIAPTITAQPQSQTPCENTSVTFTVTATGDATLRYQWRKDGSPVGTDSPSYTIASVSTTDAGDYDVVVTNACGSATSAIATLTVKTLPTITTHPVGDNVCEGVSVTFTVAASGTAPLSYQWQRFNSVSFIWEDLPGETNTTLVIVSPTLASKGSYRVLVSNLCGMDTSATAFLTVRAAPTPTIVATPGATVCQGTTVMLDAGSGFLSYAWLPGGETTQTIQVTAGGTYSVTVTNAIGCTGGDSISVTVNANPAPTMTASPGATVCQGTTVTLDAGAGFSSYSWTPGGETTQTIQVTAGGTYGVTVTDGAGCQGTGSIIVTVNTNPTPTITASPGATVCQGTMVTLDAGAGFSSYSWSPGGETTQAIQVTAAGTYGVTVTDGNGCQGTDSIAVATNATPTPAITASPGATVCQGTTVTLDAGAGFSSYSWTPGGETTQTIQVTAGGTYGVTVTDANGCQGTAGIIVTVNTNPVPTITASPSATVCQGTTVTLDAGAGFSSYSWTPGGETTQQIQVTAGGTYGVTVTNASGCVGSDSIIVTVNTNPAPAITASPGATVCQGTMVTLDAGAGFSSYSWSPGGETTQAIQVTAAGTYGVTVTDGNGCQGTDSIAVATNATPTPAITASPGATVCQGTTVTLDAGAGFNSYSWTPGGETTQTIQVTAGGTYGVTVTDANGCQGTAGIFVTVNTNPVPTIAASPGATVCQGTTVTLDAGAGFSSYSWTPGGETTQQIQVTAGGTYGVTVTDGNGCQGTDSITVIANTNPAPTIAASPGATVCQGTTVTLDAGAGFSAYLWTPGGETTQTIQVTAGGTYGVTVTDGAGCQGTGSIIVTVNTNPTPTITASPGATVCQGTMVTLDAGAGFSSYSWSPGGETTQAIQVTAAGTYGVTVTDGNGCQGTDSILVTTNSGPMITGDPGSQSACVGDLVTFTVTASGTSPLNYQWRQDGNPVGTNSPTFTIGAASVVDAGSYDVVVTNACGSVTSAIAVLTVDNVAPTFSGCPADILVNNDPGLCTAIVSWTPPQASDNCAIATVTTTNNPGEAFPVGVTTVTYTAQDTAGNGATCVFNVTVNDAEAPSIMLPCTAIDTNVVVAAGGLCEAAGVATTPGLGQFALAVPAATDNCDAAPDLSCVRSDGLPCVVDNLVAPPVLTTDPFPCNQTVTLTWTATDTAGNSMNCTQDVLIHTWSEVTVTVQLEGGISPVSVDRCITFELHLCDAMASSCGQAEPIITDQLIAFPRSTGTGGMTFLVPCGQYSCITARDTLHTLRRTIDVLPIVGTQYNAQFTTAAGTKSLIQGNLNDDCWIDVIDFGLLAGQWSQTPPAMTCPTTPTPAHADFNGDGVVWTADFTFVQLNIFKFSELNCCNAQPLCGGFMGAQAPTGRLGGPVERISIRELDRLGLPEAAAGDLNRDNWLDTKDIDLWIEGRRPGAGPRPPSERPVYLTPGREEDSVIGPGDALRGSKPQKWGP